MLKRRFALMTVAFAASAALLPVPAMAQQKITVGVSLAQNAWLCAAAGCTKADLASTTSGGSWSSWPFSQPVPTYVCLTAS